MFYSVWILKISEISRVRRQSMQWNSGERLNQNIFHVSESWYQVCMLIQEGPCLLFFFLFFFPLSFEKRELYKPSAWHWCFHLPKFFTYSICRFWFGFASLLFSEVFLLLRFLGQFLKRSYFLHFCFVFLLVLTYTNNVIRNMVKFLRPLDREVLIGEGSWKLYITTRVKIRNQKGNN